METIGIVIFYKGGSILWECDGFAYIDKLNNCMNYAIRTALEGGATLPEIRDMYLEVCDDYTRKKDDEFEEFDFPALATALKVCIKLKAFQKDDENRLAIFVENEKTTSLVAIDKL